MKLTFFLWNGKKFSFPIPLPCLDCNTDEKAAPYMIKMYGAAFHNVLLVQLCACWNSVIHHQKIEAFVPVNLMDGGD